MSLPPELAATLATLVETTVTWRPSHRLIVAGGADRARRSPFARIGLSGADALAVLRSTAIRRRAEAAASPANAALAALARAEEQAVARLTALDGRNPGALSAGSEADALVLGAFAYGGPTRFSDGSVGCYYAAEQFETAIAETRHHQAVAFGDSRASAGACVDLVDIEADVVATLPDLRPLWSTHPDVYDPGNYAVAREVGAALVAAGHQGILYTSVRDVARGPCVAAFAGGIVRGARRAATVRYRWDGTAIHVEPIR